MGIRLSQFLRPPMWEKFTLLVHALQHRDARKFRVFTTVVQCLLHIMPLQGTHDRLQDMTAKIIAPGRTPKFALGGEAVPVCRIVGEILLDRRRQRAHIERCCPRWAKDFADDSRS